MVYTPGYGWYVILGLSLIPKQRSLWSPILQLVWEVGKGCSDSRKWYCFVNSNMVKPGKYDHNIHVFYNITTYTIIFDLVINFFSWCM